MLHPDLGSSSQEQCGPIEVGPEKATRLSQDWSTSAMKTEWKIGIVQPGEGKAQRRSYSSLTVPKGGL